MSDVIVCYAKCWPCQFGQHFEPPQAHTWMDDEDFDHAVATGQFAEGATFAEAAKESRCGCWCAETDRSDSTGERP